MAPGALVGPAGLANVASMSTYADRPAWQKELGRKLGASSAAVLLLGLAPACATLELPETATTFTIDATRAVDATDDAGAARTATVLATVKGRTLRLKVDPGAPGLVLLNGSTARTLALPTGEPGSYTVGPITL